jgi:hypothetical protein
MKTKMKMKMKNKLPGRHKAKPDISNLESSAIDASQTSSKPVDFHEALKPVATCDNPQVKDDDVNSTTICRNREDEKRRDSYELCTCPDPTGQVNKTYCLVPYRPLRTTDIDGKKYGSLHDLGEIAGIPIGAFTGYLREEEDHVRGAPGYLEPNEIYHLRYWGINDLGIRVEAALPYFMKARGGQRLAEWLLETVIPDTISGTCAKKSIVKKQQVAKSDKPMQHRYYHPDLGELRGVVIGTRFWVNMSDTSRFTSLPEEVVSRIAYASGTIEIPNVDVYNADEHQGTERYILFDVVINILQAMQPSDYLVTSLEQWVNNDIFKLSRQLDSGSYVHASTLHPMLGRHLEFQVWCEELRFKVPYSIFDIEHYIEDEFDFDFKIPLTVARDIAQHHKSFAGEITHNLICDGGFFHNGSIGEPADATLKRFVGLIPDRFGRVEARKVHEYASTSESFDEWVLQCVKTCAPDDLSNIHDEIITLREADCRGLWRSCITAY